MHWGVLLSVFIVFLVLLIVGGLMLSNRLYDDLDDQDKCTDPKNWPKDCKDCCAIWDTNVCRKGKMVGNECISKPNYLAGILLLLSFIFLIVFIVLLFFYFSRKNNNTK